MPYLLDTNVVTQLLKRTPGVVAKYRRALELGEQVYFSAAVYYEIKRGLLHLGAARQLRQLDEDFKDVLDWASVSDATWDRAASYGRNVVGREDPMTMTETFSSQLRHIY